MAKVNYSLSYNCRVAEAAKVYTARKEREDNPDGDFDKAGRWYPSIDEELTCCSGIRTPSRSWPYSLMIHCRSLDHVAGLFGVLKSDVRKYIKNGSLPKTEEGHYYKLVSVVNDEYFSIFDGETKYEIGKALMEEARPDFEGGFCVYKTTEEAERAIFPKGSKLLNEPKILLKIKCSGNYCKYENGKIAFSQIVPVEVVSKTSSND